MFSFFAYSITLILKWDVNFLCEIFQGFWSNAAFFCSAILKNFCLGLIPCRKYWPCAMTAHDVNKKPQALNILFCRRKWQESMFIKKGALLERGVYAFNYSLFGGVYWKGGIIGRGGLRELSRYVLQGLPTSCLSLEEKHIPFICYFEVTFVYQVSQKSRNVWSATKHDAFVQLQNFLADTKHS